MTQSKDQKTIERLKARLKEFQHLNDSQGMIILKQGDEIKALLSDKEFYQGKVLEVDKKAESLQSENDSLQKHFRDEMNDQVTRLKGFQMMMDTFEASSANEETTILCQFIWTTIQHQITAVEKLIETL